MLARRAATLVALAAVLSGACSSTEAPERPSLGIANGTTLTVTLVVNGQPIGESRPGEEPSIDVSSLPELPWVVEARSPNGRVLTSMRVEPGQVWTKVGPGGVVEHSGTFGRVDLSCGRLTIWAGDVIPSGPVPDPSAGSPGDCDP
ncbi:MAG: hypothetical protein AB1736_02995 [Chloroflexota bacterium]